MQRLTKKIKIDLIIIAFHLIWKLKSWFKLDMIYIYIFIRIDYDF